MKHKITKSPLKKLPRFKSEDEERDFWATHSPLDYFDHSHPVEMDLSNLKPSTKSITIRLPLHLYQDLKMMANKRDVPYQSLMKTLLYQSVKEEKGEYKTK